MSIYQRFCEETVDQNGRLTDITVKFPDDFNFGYDVVDAIADETPEKRALVWCNTENEEYFFSFGDIKRLSNKAANVFLNSGIKKGDAVMVMLKRHFEYWYTAVALHKIGAVLIPVTHMLTEDDIVYRIKSADVKGVVCTPQGDAPENVLSAAKSTGKDIRLWTVQSDINGFENLTRSVEAADDTLDRCDTLATDRMVLYFTSGTTGYPKGVVHDYTYPLAHIVTAKYWQQAEEDGLHFTVAETGWAKASWGKIYGQWLVGSAVMVYDFDNFEPKQLAAVINRYGVTSFCAPPTVYRYLVRKGTPKMPGLRHASTAGEMLSPEVFKLFTEQTGIPLAEGYGQTETTLLTANFKGNALAEGALGTPSPLYNVAVVRKDGTIAPPGEIGEVVVMPKNGQRPIGILSEYLDNDELYEHVWRGGMYHTGDAAWRDKNGIYWFHGRFDDIIKTGGFRVGPYEVENVLMEHPAVMECTVVGVPDKLRGQAVKAVIVPAPGYSPTKELEKDIREFCNSRVAEYKWVRIVEFITDMPKTISGKIRKVELRK